MSTKPLTKAQHVHVIRELSAREMDRILDHLTEVMPDVVEQATNRIRPNRRRGPLTAHDLIKVLGIVYGADPTAWVDAVQSVRPDLIPAQL
jgi:hypothetical protein